jgi:hypothetical protein
MQGRGVTNYSIDKPSHSFTTNTDQFDDALIARNTITFEHAMIAKGASPAEAKRLADLKVQQDQAAAAPPQHYSIGTRTTPYQHNDENDDNHDDDNDAIIEEYRTKRLMQLQRGNVIPISRTEWSEEVNRASESQWVVILLTSAASAPNLNPYHKDQCLKVETDVVPHLAGKFSEVKWVSIPSKAAIENWPDENLPTVFCYRRGELQCQLVGLAEFGCIHADDLEYKLGKMGVLESNIEVDPQISRGVHDTDNMKGRGSSTRTAPSSYGRSKFQGGMATFATNDSDDCLSDYDEVD